MKNFGENIGREFITHGENPDPRDLIIHEVVEGSPYEEPTIPILKPTYGVFAYLTGMEKDKIDDFSSSLEDESGMLELISGIKMWVNETKDDFVQNERVINTALVALRGLEKNEFFVKSSIEKKQVDTLITELEDRIQQSRD